MTDRAVPPGDIAPAEFFTRWIPRMVDDDAQRRRRLGETKATLEFELEGEEGGLFTLHVADGRVRGELGAAEGHPDLRVRLDVPTWRALNRGDISAPEALLRRRVHLRGNLVLALKLHLIIGS